MKMPAKVLAQHITSICRLHCISIRSHSSGGRGCKRGRWIAIRPVKSSITYAIALHEIGHILGPRQSGVRLDKEVGAWEWAEENAMVWNDAMEACRRRCLLSYVKWAKRRRGVKVPADDHPIWRLAA